MPVLSQADSPDAHVMDGPEDILPIDGSGPASVRPISTVDVIFGLFVVSTVVYWTISLRELWFVFDDWPISDRVRDGSTIVEPYNGHLIITTLAISRLLYGVFGYSTYTPMQLAGFIAFASIPVLFYFLSRSVIGPNLAAILAALLLWPPMIVLDPISMAHWFVGAGAVATAWGLRGRSARHDLVVAGGLTFALISSGGGVAVAAACLAHSALTRASGRRWLAALVPSVLWATWWAAIGRRAERSIFAMTPSLRSLAGDAFQGVFGSFTQIGLGKGIVGAGLAVSFGAIFVIRLRGDREAAVSQAAWSVALIVWWAGVSSTRHGFAVAEVFRYRHIGACLILLAVLPTTGTPRHDFRAESTTRRLLKVSAVTFSLAVVAAFAYQDLAEFRRIWTGFGRLQRVQAAAISMGPAVVPSNVDIGWGFSVHPDTLRSLFDHWGQPPNHDNPGAVTRDASSFRLVDRPLEPFGECASPTAILTLKPEAIVIIIAGEQATDVSLRRFDSDWLTVGSIPPNAAAKVGLSSVLSPLPWEIRAPGACMVVAEP